MPYTVTDIVDGGVPNIEALSGRFSFRIQKNARDFAALTMTYAKREDAERGREAALKMIKNAV
jgi:hypothetical protein